MPSLLLVVFVLQVVIHLVNTVGAPVINEFVSGPPGCWLGSLSATDIASSFGCFGISFHTLLLPQMFNYRRKDEGSSLD